LFKIEGRNASSWGEPASFGRGAKSPSRPHKKKKKIFKGKRLRYLWNKELPGSGESRGLAVSNPRKKSS